MVYNGAQEVIVFFLPSNFSYRLIGPLVWVSDIVFILAMFDFKKIWGKILGKENKEIKHKERKSRGK